MSTPKIYKNRLAKYICVTIYVKQVISKLEKKVKLEKYESVFSIKEKYGGLRIDGIGTDDLEIELEEKSQKICEECGKAGELRDLSWVRTLCTEHYKERRYLGGSIS